MAKRVLSFDDDDNPAFKPYKKCFDCYAYHVNCSQDCSGHFPRRPETLLSAGLKYHMPPYFIFLLCLLAAAFVFLCYVTILKRYRLDLRLLRREPPPPPLEDFADGDRSPLDHPVWYIRTVGLPASVIESITVFKYRRGERLTDGSDCAVCLTEFQEDEILRLLPKCSHAFHVSCIDTWLRSHKNCPMCRAPVAGGSDTDVTAVEINSDVAVAGEQESSAEAASSDPGNHETIIATDHKGGRTLSDLAEHRVGVGQHIPPAARRSASLDFSSVSMTCVSAGEMGPSVSSSSGSRSWYRAMKTSSFRLPLRSSSSTSNGNCSLPTAT